MRIGTPDVPCLILTCIGLGKVISSHPCKNMHTHPITGDLSRTPADYSFVSVISYGMIAVGRSDMSGSLSSVDTCVRSRGSRRTPNRCIKRGNMKP